MLILIFNCFVMVRMDFDSNSNEYFSQLHVPIGIECFHKRRNWERNSTWFVENSSITTNNSKYLGGCYHSPSSTDPYALAKEACQSEGGILTTIHDQDKQLFLLQCKVSMSQILTTLKIAVISLYGAKVKFWIGNEYNGKEWEWIDDVRDITKNLKSIFLIQSNSTFSNWASGQPDSSLGRCSISQQTVGFNSGWLVIIILQYFFNLPLNDHYFQVRGRLFWWSFLYLWASSLFSQSILSLIHYIYFC